MVNNIVLVGNPNTGKTTLFNSLASANEHTGNWNGVTVNSKNKSFLYKNKEYNLIDLPGVYSLTPLSLEEKVTTDFLFNNKDLLILNIVDANNIYKNLYLTIELLKLKIPTILVINNMGNLSSNLYKINIKKLQDFLGILVVEINTQNKENCKNLLNLIDCYNNKKNLNINENLLKNSEKIEKNKQNLKNIINFNLKNTNLNENFVLTKCLECDDNIIKSLKLNGGQTALLNQIQNQISVEEMVEENYKKIDLIFEAEAIKKSGKIYGKSKLDKFVLNKYLCLPIFALILLLMFYLTFFSVGLGFGNLFSGFVQNVFGKWLLEFVSGVTKSAVVYDFFSTAIIGGIGSILSFLPQVVMLFLCLGILEDSGYLSRIAFMLDDIFTKVGLSGKSVYVLLMGFGCSGVSMLSARSMENKKLQTKTAIIAPYISCSARLPIYAVLGSAFFGAGNVFVVFSMYVLGVVVALILSMFYEKTFLKTKTNSFILEFTPYKKIQLNRVVNLVKTNSKDFIIRIGSLLFSVNIIIWILSNFSFNFTFIKNTGGHSMLEALGKIIAPVFAPLGFGTWGPAAAILAGLVAKEIVVSSISMFNNVSLTGANFKDGIISSLTNPQSAVFFTPASAISFMVFCLLYNPCFASMAILKKEVGTKWFVISSVVQFVIAYVISLFVYSAINLIVCKGVLAFFVLFLMFALIAFAALHFVNYYAKKQKCKRCGRCK